MAMGSRTAVNPALAVTCRIVPGRKSDSSLAGDNHCRRWRIPSATSLGTYSTFSSMMLSHLHPNSAKFHSWRRATDSDTDITIAG